MAPLFNIGSLRKSPIVNRVRNIYRENTTDSALESLRMQSVNISHIRDLSTGLKSSSSDSSEEELDSYQRIDFPNRKRFHERRLQKTQSEAMEAAELQRNNTFSEYEKRKNKEESPRDSNDSFESPLDSELEYKTPNQSQGDLSPLQLLLNYKQESDKKEENLTSVDSFKTIQSPELSPVAKKTNERQGWENERTNKGVVTPSNKDETDRTEELGNLSYSFSKTCYVFRICFEPKLSTVKETSFIPSRIIINKSPFIIGSDSSCDLVLPKRKFKFIAPKHCKITYQSSVGSKMSQREGSPVKVEGSSSSPPEEGEEEQDIVSYRVKITKSSPSGTTYVNNSILRGSFYLGNGDLVSLGPRNNYLTFRMIFRSKKECHLLKSQLSISSQRSMSIDKEWKDEDEDDEDEEYADDDDDYKEEIKTDREERLLPVDKINITGVKIFVFQIFNYHNSFDLEERKVKKESKTGIGNEVRMGDNELDDNMEETKLNYQELGDIELEELEGEGGLEKEEDEDEGDDEQEEEDEEYQPEGYSQTMKKGTKGKNKSLKEKKKNEESEYYKLRSPVRNYELIKSPVSRVSLSQELYIRNVEPFKTEELLEVYSSSERFSNNSGPNSCKNELNTENNNNDNNNDNNNNDNNNKKEDSDKYDDNDKDYEHKEYKDKEEEKYWNKVEFLKSVTKNDFPIVIETNRSSVSGETSPGGSRTSYKLIGIVDGSNNMSISELLSNIDQLVRRNIEENLENFQVVLKKYNKPVEREMLESSWVFQLEFLDTENPKIKRAIYKHEMFREDKGYLERILKDNKCRVMYIKTD